MKIHFHGHSCIQIQFEGHSVILDPFLNGNPAAKAKPEDIKVDYVLVTHGHGDHVGDAVDIAKRNGAPIIATNDLAAYLATQGVKTHALGIGGKFDFPFGTVKLTMAVHDSSYVDPQTKQRIYTGLATGILIMAEGRTLFHAGDTGLFGDMQLIGQRNPIDLAFLPIGDNFTMGPDEAIEAARFLGTKSVVPIHYNTFPLLEQDGHSFAKKLSGHGIKGIVLEPGQHLEL